LSKIQWRVLGVTDFDDINECKLEFEENCPLKHSNIIDRLVCDEDIFADKIIRVARYRKSVIKTDDEKPLSGKVRILKGTIWVGHAIYDRNLADEAENSIINPTGERHMPLTEVREYAKLDDADYEKLIKRLEQGDDTFFDDEERSHMYDSDREILKKFYGIGRPAMTHKEIAAEEEVTHCFVKQKIEAVLRQLKYVVVKKEKEENFECDDYILKLIPELANSLPDNLERSCLTDREREILQMYKGIGCQAMTFEEIAGKFALTSNRVRQIIEKASRRLKKG
jgi:DNA-directed RNA polymerase sigma subunit (sigma70/sigma32)